MARPRNSRPQLTRDSLGRGNATPGAPSTSIQWLGMAVSWYAEDARGERRLRGTPPPHSLRCGVADVGSPARGLTSEWSWRALRSCGRITFVRRPADAGRAGARAPAAVRARSSFALR